MNKTKPRKYSRAFKQEVIAYYLSHDLPKQHVWDKFVGGEEKGHLTKWLRQLGYLPQLLPQKSYLDPMKDSSKTPSIESSPESLLKRIAELEAELTNEKLKSEAYWRMIDLAEETFEIPIRKKLPTKPSKR